MLQQHLQQQHLGPVDQQRRQEALVFSMQEDGQGHFVTRSISMNSCNVSYLRSTTAVSRATSGTPLSVPAAETAAAGAATAAAEEEQHGVGGLLHSLIPRISASVSSLLFPVSQPPVTPSVSAAVAAAAAAAAAEEALQHKGRSSTQLVVLLQPAPSSSSSSSSRFNLAAAAAEGGDTVEVSLQQYLLCKLRGHPVLDAEPFGALHADGLSHAGLVVWGDPERLLLLLEEAGAMKKTLTKKFAPFRFRCKPFFECSDDADTFLTPHEEAELILGELLAMRFGVDAPFQSLQGLGVLDVCLATGILCDVFPLHLPDARLSIHLKLQQQQQNQQQKQKQQQKLRLANPSASLDSMLAAYCGFSMNSLFLLLRAGWRFCVSLLLMELLLLLLQLVGDRGAEEATRVRSVCAATAAAAATAANSTSPATQAMRAVAAAGTLAWGVSTDPLFLLLTSKAFKAAAALAVAFAVPVFFRSVQRKLPAYRYSLGLDALSHLGGPGGLTEKPFPPLQLLQRRLRLLLLFGASPTESLSFSCHPRFRDFFLPLFSGYVPSLQQQQQLAAAAAATAATAETAAAEAGVVPTRKSFMQQQKQQQQTFAAAVKHLQGFSWWKGLFSIAAAAQLLLLLLLLLLHADIIHRSAAPEEWSLWMAPADAAATATAARAATATASRAAAARVEGLVAQAAAPLWGPAWLAVQRLQQSSSAVELLLLLPLLMPVLLRFAAGPLGVWTALRAVAVAVADMSLSFRKIGVLSASADFPSEKAYMASVQQMFLLLTTLGASAAIYMSAAAAAAAAGTLGAVCPFSAFFALQLLLFFAAELFRLTFAARVPQLPAAAAAAASSSSSSSNSSGEEKAAAAAAAAAAVAEAALPPMRLEYFYGSFCLELCLLPLAAAHRVLLLCLLLQCLLLPLRLREACVQLLQRRRCSSCCIGELPQPLGSWLPRMGVVGACCVLGSLFGFVRSLLLLEQQQELLHAENQRLLLLREPLLAAVSGMGLAVVVGTALCLILLLQQTFGERSEEESLQGIYEIAEREVSAFEFNFSILQPSECLLARVVSAPPGKSEHHWLFSSLSRMLYPLHQLQQQQQQHWNWLELVKQLLLPPLLPLEGGSSDLPLLHGGIKRLDATLLKIQGGPGASEADAIEPFSPRRLDLATDQYLDAMLQREGPRAPFLPEASGASSETQPKVLDKRVLNRFLGKWQFDASRSTSMSPISEHLGVPWLVRNAVEKLSPTIEYVLNDKDGQLEFAITTRLTAGISKTVRLNLSGANVEAEDEDVGAWRSVTHVEGSVLKTTQKNDQQKATLFETREIRPDGEGTETDVLWYNVTLRKEGIPNEVSAVRVFKRISGPPADVAEASGEQVAESDGSISTASSPSKAVATLENEEGTQLQPIWHAFKPREAAVSAEIQWIVDNLDDASVFQKSAGRGFETFKADHYKFRVSEGQRISPGDVVPVMGIGRINLGKVDFQKCIDYLVIPESKMEFDTTTSKVITIVNDKNFSLVYQAFKGQWGFAGREFVIACWNTQVNENRTILSCESVEWTDPVEGHIEGLVRGNLLLAGYDLQKQPNGDVILCFCVQADLKTMGVPDWINTRVKAEQLTVVKYIKDKILKL